MSFIIELIGQEWKQNFTLLGAPVNLTFEFAEVILMGEHSSGCLLHNVLQKFIAGFLKLVLTFSLGTSEGERSIPLSYG